MVNNTGIDMITHPRVAVSIDRSTLVTLALLAENSRAGLVFCAENPDLVQLSSGGKTAEHYKAAIEHLDTAAKEAKQVLAATAIGTDSTSDTAAPAIPLTPATASDARTDMFFEHLTQKVYLAEGHSVMESIAEHVLSQNGNCGAIRQATDYIEFPVEDWICDVSNNDTRLGYEDWVKSQREAHD